MVTMGWSYFARKFITESTARQLDSSTSSSNNPMRELRCRNGIIMRWAQSNQRQNQREKNGSHHHISTSVEDKSGTEHGIECSQALLEETGRSTNRKEMKSCRSKKSDRVSWIQLSIVCLISYELVSLVSHLQSASGAPSYQGTLLPTVEGTLIIGDSAFEVQEIRSQIQHDPPIQSLEEFQSVHQHNLPNQQHLQDFQHHHEGLVGEGLVGSGETAHLLPSIELENRKLESVRRPAAMVAAPLPPLEAPMKSESRNTALEDITDGDKASRASHDYEMRDLKPISEKDLTKVLPAKLEQHPRENLNDVQGDPRSTKAIAGKIVDFELESAGGHNKAKIKKKQKKMKEAEEFKKWGHKMGSEKKAVDMMHKQAEKKKKSEGHKGKKKWGKEVHGHKKKGNFKKKKWGEKVKKGHGLKKGKKGKKFLKDVGHKNTGFKTVYHKEEWGKSSKWHDIDRQKKWDEKSKKWNKKWKKEKGKKYKGNHMKKFEKKKKSGKKYSKKHEDKFKKFKKEEFEKGKKKKMEQKSKKKEGGSKKAAEMMKKKKKKGMY